MKNESVGFLVIIGIAIFVCATLFQFWPVVLILALIIAVATIIATLIDNNEIKNIQSAEISERIQWTKEKYKHSGISMGTRGGLRGYWRVKNVPHHIEVKFLVTYLNGDVRVVSANEGTKKYVALMHCVERQKQPQSLRDDNRLHQNYQPVETLQIQPKEKGVPTSSLCAGIYCIGEDIPTGKFNLIAESGGGQISLFKNAYSSEMVLFENFGVTEDYMLHEYRNIQLEKGDTLKISGTVVVQLVKCIPIVIN